MFYRLSIHKCIWHVLPFHYKQDVSQLDFHNLFCTKLPIFAHSKAQVLEYNYLVLWLSDGLCHYVRMQMRDLEWFEEFYSINYLWYDRIDKYILHESSPHLHFTWTPSPSQAGWVPAGVLQLVWHQLIQLGRDESSGIGTQVEPELWAFVKSIIVDTKQSSKSIFISLLDYEKKWSESSMIIKSQVI